MVLNAAALTVRLHTQGGLDAALHLLVVLVRQEDVVEAAGRVALNPLDLEQVAHLQSETQTTFEACKT